MSRIIRPAVQDGEGIDGPDLNTRFSDYTQTDLNAFNHRNAAYDLPQFERPGASLYGFLGKYQNSITLGKDDWKHTSSVTVAGTATSPPAAPYVVGDGVSPTVMSFGVAGQTVAANDVLRVYWDLSVYPHWIGSRPWAATDSNHISNGGGGSVPIGTNGSCWAFWLQWDVTSNALANFVNVPNQGSFDTNLTGSIYGSALSDTMGTSVVPAYIDRGNPSAGTLPHTPVQVAVGWRGISGAWYYPRTSGSQTIYGMRLVFTGVLLPYYNAGTSSNALVHDTAWADDARMSYNGGKLNAFIQRVG